MRRGEGTISANGRDVQIFFSAATLGRLDRQMNASTLSALAGQRLDVMAQVLAAGMSNTGRRASVEDAYRVIDDAGLLVVAEALVEAIKSALHIDIDDLENADVEYGEDIDPN